MINFNFFFRKKYKFGINFLTGCSDGELLLYDGITLSYNHSNGTVLVCVDNEYGTVCDDWWDPLDASVVCNQLGYSSNGWH